MQVPPQYFLLGSLNKAIAYPRMSPDLQCVLRVVLTCVHTLGCIRNVTGTMCTHRELHHVGGGAGVPPMCRTFTVCAACETACGDKTLSLSERRKVMAGGGYCK